MYRLKILFLLCFFGVTVFPGTAQDSNIPTRVYEALDALNAKLGLQLRFEDFERWSWSEEVYETTAMGCSTYPNPEQRSTTGFRILFLYEGIQYVYYYPRDGALFFCDPAPRAIPADTPVPTPGVYANCAVSPRLIAGEGAIIQDDEQHLPNALREAPSPDARLLAQIPPLAQITVLEGPDCSTAFTYWRVSYNGLVGWTPEGTDGEYFITHVTALPPEPDATGCVIAPRLDAGIEGRVLAGETDRINLRALPFPDADKVGEMAAGDVFRTLAGPICHAEYNYWQVEYQGMTAWAAEGTAEDGYYLEPLSKVVDTSRVRFVYPLALADSAPGLFARDVPPENAGEVPPGGILPEHHHFTLSKADNTPAGDIRIFRASDYEAYYPGSITTLDSILAQRSAAGAPDIGQTKLYITGEIMYRARESFVTLPDGGAAWRMLVDAVEPGAPQTGDVQYLALALSADKRYFIQAALRMNAGVFPDENTPAESEPPGDLSDPAFQALIGEYLTRVQTEVIPALENAPPETFTPSLESLDALMSSLHIKGAILPPRAVAQQCGTLTTRLVIGAEGRVAPGSANNLRSQPNRDAERTGQIEPGQTFNVIEGPVCDGTMAWWRVEANGLNGWTVEGDGSDYWVEPVGQPAPPPLSLVAIVTPPSIADLMAAQPGETPAALTPSPDITPSAETPIAAPPTEAPAQTVCPGFLPSRLVVGMRGRVLPGDSNNVREQSNSDSALVGQIPGGAEFNVLEGPVCGSGGAWWRVSYNGLTGWTLEGQGNDYWLEPVN